MTRANGTVWTLKGILCPGCGSNSSRVIDSREHPGTIRRRRVCVKCGGRWSTQEHVIGFRPGKRTKRSERA